MLRSPPEKRARFAARLAAALHTVREGDRIADVCWDGEGYCCALAFSPWL